MKDDDVHPGDRPKAELSPEDRVSTHPRQVFSGLEIGLANQQAYCLRCDCRLIEGDTIMIYAYRPAEASEWCLVRCYCQDCAPGQIETPTVDTSEVLASATLGTLSRVTEQVHHLCLTHVEVIDQSAPEEGIHS